MATNRSTPVSLFHPNPKPIRERRRPSKPQRCQPEPSSGPESARIRAFCFLAVIAPPPFGDCSLKIHSTARVELVDNCAAQHQRMWHMGCAPAFQAGQSSSSLGFRSISGVPMQHAHDQPRERRALCAGSKRAGAAGEPGEVDLAPRARTQPKWFSRFLRKADLFMRPAARRQRGSRLCVGLPQKSPL